MFIFSFILSLFANHLPVMYVQVPQWADDWAVCAVDIPDAINILVFLMCQAIFVFFKYLLRNNTRETFEFFKPNYTVKFIV